VEQTIALCLASYIGPVLVLALLIVAPMSGSVREIARYAITCALSILVAWLLTVIGKNLPVWPGHPHFPSGHAAFGAAAAAGLVWRRTALLPAAIAALAGLAWGLVAAKFHTPVEVAGGLALGVLVALGIQRLAVFLAPMPLEPLSPPR
jgi:membrane-associated phospholipid phosphatase